jgi:signal transduction histidine kinase
VNPASSHWHTGVLQFAVLGLSIFVGVELAIQHPSLLPIAVLGVLFVLSISAVVRRKSKIATDQTRRAVPSLMHANSGKSYLSAAALHDIHLPLSAVQGYLETLLLQDGKLDTQTRNDFLQIALRSSKRIERILDDLFFLSRVDCNEVPLRLERFCVVDVISDLVNAFRMRAAERAVSIALWLTPSDTLLKQVVADITLIDRLFGNLLDNALRHTPAGGCIAVHMRLVGEAWCIRISDTGPGVATEHRRNIFKPFAQAERNNSDSNKSCGLGLAIANCIIRLHNGEIAVHRNLAGGAVFSVVLPIGKATTAYAANRGNDRLGVA